MDLIHVWYGYRYWSKILYGTICFSYMTLSKVKVTDIIFMLKFCIKVFTLSVFAKPLIDLIMYGMVVETCPMAW